jgi:hypothetical protein
MSIHFISIIPSAAHAAQGPALHPDVFDPALSDTDLTAQDIRAFFRDPDWQSLESRNQQGTFLFDFARCNCSLGLSNQFLARVFNISPQNVVKIRDKTRKLYNLLTTP